MNNLAPTSVDSASSTLPDTGEQANFSKNPEQMRRSASRACALLKTMANEDRLLLMCQLAESEYSVSELEAMTDIRQPTLSQQLGVLRDEGLVATRREGKRIYYRLASAEVVAVMQTLWQLYCKPVQGKS